MIGLYKAELIRPEGPWCPLQDVEFATLAWVAWFNQERLMEPPDYVPPAEFEQAYYKQANPSEAAVTLT